MPQPCAFIALRTSFCTQVGEAEVLGAERAGGVVARDAARVVGRAAGVEVDADEQVGLGRVGADVAGGDVVVHALRREEAAGDVVGPAGGSPSRPWYATRRR